MKSAKVLTSVTNNAPQILTSASRADGSGKSQL